MESQKSKLVNDKVRRGTTTRGSFDFMQAASVTMPKTYFSSIKNVVNQIAKRPEKSPFSRDAMSIQEETAFKRTR